MVNGGPQGRYHRSEIHNASAGRKGRDRKLFPALKSRAGANAANDQSFWKRNGRADVDVLVSSDKFAHPAAVNGGV